MWCKKRLLKVAHQRCCRMFSECRQKTCQIDQTGRGVSFECRSASRPRSVDVVCAECNQHAPFVCGGSRRQDSIRTKRGKALFHPWHSSVRRLGPLDSRFEQGRYLGPMDGSNTVFIRTASGVVKARTIKRLPPGERWTGTLLDEALGSELIPNALEDDCGKVGIRAPVLQPHAAILLPPLVPEVRKVRGAPLRRTDFEQHGYTDNCRGCANSRAVRKQAVDDSEQCRSRMETVLSTTTEGHERLERARDHCAPNDHECNVPAIAIRPGCRWKFGSIAASSASAKAGHPGG